MYTNELYEQVPVMRTKNNTQIVYEIGELLLYELRLYQMYICPPTNSDKWSSTVDAIP